MFNMPDIEVTSHGQRAVDAGQVQRLYAGVGWWPERSIADDRILASGPAVGAWSGSFLVRFVRAVTDGVARAHVEDMVVDRDDVVKASVRSLMVQLHQELNGVRVVSLFCGAGLTALHESAGYRFAAQRVGHHQV